MKCSKSWDMHLHWLGDRETRERFNDILKKGLDNRVDDFTKHHPTVYHRVQRKIILETKFNQHAINVTTRDCKGVLILHMTSPVP